MVVENPVGAAQNRLAVPLRVPRYPKARLEVVSVGLNAFLQSEILISGLGQGGWGLKFWRNFHVITHAEIQRDPRTDTPGILPENANGNVMERVTGTAQALNKISGKPGAVGLHRGKVGKSRREPQSACTERADVVHAAIIHRKNGCDGKIVDVSAKFHIMAANAPRKVVDELIAVFDALNI